MSYIVTEYWDRFLIFLPRLAFAMVVFIILIIVAVQVEKLMNRRLARKAHDLLLAMFISRLAKLIIIVMGFILTFNILGLTGIAGGLLAGAGVSAFIVGFAFKDIAENFLAGVILAFR